MRIETHVDLKPYNTFGLPALAHQLVRIRTLDDIKTVLQHPELAKRPKFILGGGSNIVLTQDVDAVVLKIEIMGRNLIDDTPAAWVVQAGAGESWRDLVTWTIDQGWHGLENLALIPGTVGAAPVQNIGAYGVELKDRFLAVDGIDLNTGRTFTMDGPKCRFGYRDSIFKHARAGKSIITTVRFKLPKPWHPMLDYPDLQKKRSAFGSSAPDARQVLEWVTQLRQTKLPDPDRVGNAGSFFKNPMVAKALLAAIQHKDPDVAYFLNPDGSIKLSAGWLIERCGWKGKHLGNAAVYDKQALVLINQGSASGKDVLKLAQAIQKSVNDRFGIYLEIEPTLL